MNSSNFTHYDARVNLSFPFTITDKIKITIQGLKEYNGKLIEDKIYINESSLCNILDKYVWNVTLLTKISISNLNRSNTSVCPIEANNYDIVLTEQNFKQLKLPTELFETIKFRIKLRDERRKEVIMCKDFEIFNAPNNGNINRIS